MTAYPTDSSSLAALRDHSTVPLLSKYGQLVVISPSPPIQRYNKHRSEAACLQSQTAEPNHPDTVDTKVATYLSGQVFDADDQCYHSSGTAACGDVSLNYCRDKEHQEWTISVCVSAAVSCLFQWVYAQTGVSICLALYCVSSDDPSFCDTSYTAAADGTKCDTDKICYQGECISADAVADQITLQSCDGEQSYPYCVHTTRHLLGTDRECHCVYAVSQCYGSEQRCGSGSNVESVSMLFCYSSDAACDKQSDCDDGTDEENCNYEPCPSGTTACSSGYDLCLSYDCRYTYCRLYATDHCTARTG